MYEGDRRNQKRISRREFLTLGVAGALGFLIEIGVPKKVLAELEKLLHERPFIQKGFEAGIESLANEAKTNHLERMWVYVERGEQRGWIDVAEVATEKSVLSIKLHKLFEDKDLAKLHFVHTHPMVGYKRILHPRARTTESAQRGEIPIPPSSQDIITAFLHRDLRQRNALNYPVLDSIVDPSGLWDIAIDNEHPFVRKIDLFVDDDSPMEIFFVVFAKQYREKCDNILWGWSDSKNAFDMDERVKEFQGWARREYGIVLRYTPWGNAAPN